MTRIAVAAEAEEDTSNVASSPTADESVAIITPTSTSTTSSSSMGSPTTISSAASNFESATTTSILVTSESCLTNNDEESKKQTSSDRRVAFMDEHDEILIEQIEELDVGAIWFSPDDYFEIKAQTRLDSKDWRRKGYGVLLKETFENPIAQAQDYLNAFCQLEGTLSRRGLERHLSRRHGEERSDLKDRARYCVLSHQRRLKRDGIKSLEEMEEQLSKIYQDICRAAKVFARRIAKADELTVTQGGTNDPANAIVDENDDQGEGGRKMERRMSNFSVKSGNSLDSFRAAPTSATPRSHKGNCPNSPASPTEEYYAAIA